MILAGDIGGTKTVLALYDGASGDLRPVRERVFASQEHATFDEILRAFLAENQGPHPHAACFGVAGAVIDGRAQTTNLPWLLEERALADAIKVARVKLLNDLEAMALGMVFLHADELTPLSGPAAVTRHGNAGVIAAGTGLGEAFLLWDGEQYHPIASEGGHADFGPRDNVEIDLLDYCRGVFGDHVSYERVLSGPGLHNIYQFLRDRGYFEETPAVAETLRAGDPNAAIASLGIDGTDPLCTATVDRFCSIYGAEAGNLALRCVAIGGIYIGGGIAPKLLPALRRGKFLERFAGKGRMSSLLETIAVNVALNPRAPLIGAAQYSMRL
jgi:glucokinase